MKSKQVCKGLFGVLFAFLLLMSTVMGGRVFSPAYADTPEYTSPLEDLQKDEKFNADDYPENKKDNTIKVIQIAEGCNGELFIYTYTPNPALCCYVNRVNMSLSESVDGANLYRLLFVKNDGVFCKYVVDNFKVINAPVRYYNITSLQRAWLSSVDPVLSNGNSLRAVPISVGQLWTVENIENRIVYFASQTDVVVIEKARNGFVRYIDGLSAGGLFFDDDKDSHYVAFSCNYRIDELKGADIYYSYRSVYCRYALITGWHYSYGDSVSTVVTVKPDKITTKDHFRKHEWNRIERVSDFIENENLPAEKKQLLNGLEWVLRFAETDYYRSNDTQVETYTEVLECSILRLEFESQGISYNLGVVDGVRVPGSTPDNNAGFESFEDFIVSLLKRIWNTIKTFFTGKSTWWIYVIVAVAILVVGLPLLSVFVPVVGKVIVLIVKAVGKALWWLICLPIRGIAALVRKWRGGS